MRLRDLPATVHEQLRRAPLRKREFGDPPVGQVVVESVYVDMSFNHGHKCTFFLNRTATCARKTALAKRQEPYENTARPLPKLIRTPGLSVLPATRATPEGRTGTPRMSRTLRRAPAAIIPPRPRPRTGLPCCRRPGARPGSQRHSARPPSGNGPTFRGTASGNARCRRHPRPSLRAP